MNPPTFHLWHERYDGRQDHEKLLGVYSTSERAEAAQALLRDKPGFRDYPDGFEIFTSNRMDGTGWEEGFVSVWGDEEPDPNYVAPPPKDVRFPSVEPMPDTYRVLWHRYVDAWGIVQQKLVGIYTSQENAKKGMALVCVQPGFRDHPDGFVIDEGMIDQTAMSNGFVTIQDDRGEHDEPIQ